MKLRFYIKDDITDDYLIEHYNFIKEPWYDTYNLKYVDEDGLGIQIFHSDRSVQILLGSHTEYGCCSIPDILTRLFEDNVMKIIHY